MRRRIPIIISTICALTVAMSGCGAGADLRGSEDPVAEDAQAATVGIPDAGDAGHAMRRVFDWQVERLGSPEPDWIQSVFMMGVVSGYEATGDTAYLGAAIRWANASAWALGPRELHADDHASAQVYLDLARLTGDSSRAAAALDGLHRLIDSEEGADRIWWWCDALFMAPPALVRASRVTGDPAFADSLLGMWWDAADPLFDGEERLFHRDVAARDHRDGAAPLSRHGNKLFWSRGNGWVLSGIARTLEFLPEDHEGYAVLGSVYALMAERVIELQGGDGLWRTSMLDPWDAYDGETSGTALICHALAWGVNEGLLARALYAPPALRAWEGLVSSVDGDGRLGWVQGVGRSPGLVSESGTAPFGAGAFLLAGSEILELIESEEVERDRGTEGGR